MIRNAVIHLANEQPLLADLFGPPSGSDISLVCTNLRTMNGKRPVFADDVNSLFVFPYAHIRFVEVAPAALAAADALLPAGLPRSNGSNGGGGADGAALILAGMAEAAAGRAPAPDAPALEADPAPAVEAEPAPADEPVVDEGPVDDLDQELELDEDFLRRVKEI